MYSTNMAQLPEQVSGDQILPLELWQNILEFIDITTPEGKASLIACSYSNRGLSVASQMRLFNDINVELKVTNKDKFADFFEDEETSGPKFLSLLEGSPRIASYVRNLSVQLVHLKRPSDSCRPMFSLQLILPRLQNLRMLIIPGGWSWRWRKDVNPQIQTLFTNLLKFLPEIDIKAFSVVPISLFYGCSALEVLRIGSFVLDASVPQTTRAKLKFLEVLHPEVGQKYNPYELISWFSPTSPFDISRLVCLQLRLWDFRGVPELLAQCHQTLEELDLRIRCPQYGRAKFSYESDIPILETEHPAPDFGALHKLRFLTLLGKIFTLESHDYFHTNLLFIYAMLGTLPPKDHPSLELTLDIQVSSTPVNRLVQIASSKHLFRQLNDNPIKSQLAAVRLRSQKHHSTSKTDTWNTTSVEVLDCNEDLKSLRDQGILTYVT